MPPKAAKVVHIIANSAVMLKIIRKIGTFLMGGADDIPVPPVVQAPLPSVSASDVSNIPDSWKEYLPYLDIHETAVISPQATLQIMQLSAEPAVMLRIGAYSHVFGNFILQNKDATISIGERCHIGASHFFCTQNIVVGDDVMISWSNTFIDHDNHSIYWEERKSDALNFLREYIEFSGVTKGRFHDWTNVGKSSIHVHDKVWISFNSIILKGVSIGEGAVIGAGAVVTKDIPGWVLAAGNPGRVVRELPRSRPT